MCQVLLTISLHHFLETISAVPQVLDSFDEELWRATIEKVTKEEFAKKWRSKK